jgi:hypothetical protein
VTDPLAVNRAAGEAYRSGLAIETIHLSDLPKVQLDRFKVVVFANTWLLTADQRRFIRDKVIAGGKRHVIFQGQPGYCDGTRLAADFTRELTAAAPGVHVFGAPPITAKYLREVAAEAGAHLYTDAEGDIIHAGAGLVLIHSKDGGARKLRFRSGKSVDLALPAKSSWIFDAATGDRLLP